ncbi:hypothetical protein ACF0H5_014860 [Mactra antiquata]
MMGCTLFFVIFVLDIFIRSSESQIKCNYEYNGYKQSMGITPTSHVLAQCEPDVCSTNKCNSSNWIQFDLTKNSRFCVEWKHSALGKSYILEYHLQRHDSAMSTLFTLCMEINTDSGLGIRDSTINCVYQGSVPQRIRLRIKPCDCVNTSQHEIINQCLQPTHSAGSYTTLVTTVSTTFSDNYDKKKEIHTQDSSVAIAVVIPVIFLTCIFLVAIIYHAVKWRQDSVNIMKTSLRQSGHTINHSETNSTYRRHHNSTGVNNMDEFQINFGQDGTLHHENKNNSTIQTISQIKESSVTPSNVNISGHGLPEDIRQTFLQFNTSFESDISNFNPI